MRLLNRRNPSRSPLRRIAVAVVCALIVGPPGASAQHLALRDASPWEYPTYPGWIFTPSVGTGGTWDDNLLLVHADDEVLRDYATPVYPSLRLDYRGRHTTLSTNYDSSFLMYRDVSELNSSHQAFDFRVRQRLTPRLTMLAHENFAKVPTTDSFNLAGIPFSRVGGRTNDVGGGIEAALSRTTHLNLSYTLTSVDFDFGDDEPIASRLAGGYAHQGSLALLQRLSERFTIGGRYQVRRAVLAEGDDRFNIQDAALTGEYLLTKTTALSGFVGIAQLESGLQHSGHTGPSVGLTIGRQLPRLVTVSAGYQRTFIPSWGFGGTFENQEVMASIRVPFARNRGYLEGRGTLLEAQALEQNQPNLRSSWMGTTLGYRATRWLSLELFYDRSAQDTNRAGGERSRNMFGFRLVTSKPMKIG